MKSALSPARRLRRGAVKLLLWLSALITCTLLVGIIGFVCLRGLPALTPALLTGQENVLEGTVGIFPAVCNTLFVVTAALALVLPLGIGAAVYLTEYAPLRPLAAAVTFAADTLAGIPSILYALAGVLLFCSALGLRRTLLAGALTMAVMTLPTVIRTTQESLRAVPRSYREGALGLGAGRWHMVRTVVLPSSAGGIAAGCVLAVGRVVGESAVLMYTAGLSTAMQDFSTLRGMLSASGATLTTVLYVYAKERGDFTAAFAVATVLLALTLALDLLAALLGRGRGGGGRRG